VLPLKRPTKLKEVAAGLAADEARAIFEANNTAEDDAKIAVTATASAANVMS